MNEIEKANELARISTLTPDDLRVLFKKTDKLESLVWNESLRVAKEKCDAL